MADTLLLLADRGRRGQLPAAPPTPAAARTIAAVAVIETVAAVLVALGLRADGSGRGGRSVGASSSSSCWRARAAGVAACCSLAFCARPRARPSHRAARRPGPAVAPAAATPAPAPRATPPASARAAARLAARAGHRAWSGRPRGRPPPGLRPPAGQLPPAAHPAADRLGWQPIPGSPDVPTRSNRSS